MWAAEFTCREPDTSLLKALLGRISVSAQDQRILYGNPKNVPNTAIHEAMIERDVSQGKTTNANP